jgi:ABC-type multidrug transport system fused ATPase/permease subunit
VSNYISVLRTRKEYITGLKEDLYKILRVRAIVLVIFFSYSALLINWLLSSEVPQEAQSNSHLNYYAGQLLEEFPLVFQGGILLHLSTIYGVFLLSAFFWKYLAKTSIAIKLIVACNGLLRDTTEWIARLESRDYPEHELQELEDNDSALISQELHYKSRTIDSEINTLLYDTRVGGGAALALIFISITLLIRVYLLFLLIIALSSLIVSLELDTLWRINNFEAVLKSYSFIMFVTSSVLILLVIYYYSPTTFAVFLILILTFLYLGREFLRKLYKRHVKQISAKEIQ